MTVTTAKALVRPRISLLRNGLLALGVAGIPIFGVFSWLGIVHGTMPIVMGVIFLVALLAVIVAWRHAASFVEVRDGIIHKRTFAADNKYPVESVARIVIAETDEASTTESVPQLLAMDARGRRVFRMRGLYWTQDDMYAVANAIGVPVEVESNPMTPQQFYAEYLGAAYWYEGKRWVKIVGISLAAAGSFGVMLLMMTIAGVDFTRL